MADHHAHSHGHGHGQGHAHGKKGGHHGHGHGGHGHGPDIPRHWSKDMIEPEDETTDIDEAVAKTVQFTVPVRRRLSMAESTKGPYIKTVVNPYLEKIALEFWENERKFRVEEDEWLRKWGELG